MVTLVRPAADRMPQALLLAYIVVWLGEGVLRKWLLPSLQQPLYFLRFTVVILAVSLALTRLRRPWPWGAHIGVAYVMVIVAITAIHLERGDQSLVQGVLGIRLWLEVVLMPLALGPMLRWPDIVVASRWLAWATLFVTPLALAQVLSPATSVVNKLLAADGSDNFENEGGVVRATGLFTSSLGHATQLIIAAAAMLALLTSSRAKASDKRLATLVLPVLLILTITSGSRSAVFALALLFAVALLPSASGAYGRNILTLIVGGLALGLATRVAPNAIDGLMIRLLGEGVAEPQGRTALSAAGWLPMIGEATWFGQGLGSTVLGLANIGATYGAEQELQQWVVQLGPVLFVLALTCRLGALGYLGFRSTACLLQGRREAMYFFVAGIYTLLLGAVTSQGSVNGFAVLVIIFLLGCSNLDSPSPDSTVPSSSFVAIPSRS